MEEVWRPVVGYEGLYEVSNLGMVRSLDHYGYNGRGKTLYKSKILDFNKNKKGYVRVGLHIDNVLKYFQVHRLVGMAFPDLVGWTEDTKGKPFEELEINHKDENKENNRADNLEWCDGPYNIRYSLAKTVYQYTLDGQLVKVWPSLAECRINGFNSGNISECCNGKRKKHKGYRWSY